MLGCKSGVKKLLSERFPSIIVWHCANNRLELAVGDAVKKTSGINRFKSFIDKLYAIYHASPKNSRELHLCAESLGAELLKIRKILSRTDGCHLVCVQFWLCGIILNPLYIILKKQCMILQEIKMINALMIACKEKSHLQNFYWT